MTRRFTFLAALALVVSFATGAQAQSSGFATFNQSGNGNPISYTTTGGGLPVVLSGSTAGNFDVTNLGFLAAPGPDEFPNASLAFTATSNSVATNPAAGVFVQDGFSGTFSIVSNGTNLLSSTFSNATLSQAGGGGATFTIRSEGSSSDIFLPLFDETFSFTFANAPAFMISNGAFQNFSSNVGASFSAQVIPEPATLAMAGLGIFALPLAVRVARRRRAN